MNGNNIKSAFRLLLVTGCLLAASSCREKILISKGGEEMRFASGIESSQVMTKVTYGGEASRHTENSKTYEPLYWSVGDVVRIYCSQGDTAEIHAAAVAEGKAGKGKPYAYIADYVINEVDASKTQASLVLNSATTPIGLKWNNNADKKHSFWAIYPAPESKSTISYSYGINGKTILGKLYPEQNTLAGALTDDGDGNYTLAPDMKWMLMYGYKKDLTRATFPSEDEIFIQFKPLTTVIQFTITNSVSEDLVIKELDLISDTTQICDHFKISDVTETLDDGYPEVKCNTTITTNLHKVKLSFSSEVTIKEGKTFTFSFFLVPVSDVSDLSFRIVRGGSKGGSLTTRLGYTDGTGITFPRCKKSFVTGVMVPEGVQWAIDYTQVLTDWTYEDEETVTLN